MGEPVSHYVSHRLPEGFGLFDLHANGRDSVLFFIQSPHGRDIIAVSGSYLNPERVADQFSNLFTLKYGVAMKPKMDPKKKHEKMEKMEKNPKMKAMHERKEKKGCK